MSTKSHLAAARISGITIVSTAAGHAVVFTGLYWVEGGSLNTLEALPPLPVLLLALFLIGVIILLGGWTLARFIYQQDEHHFSPQGMRRWAFAGLTFGACVGGTTRLITRPPLEFLSSAAILIYMLEMGFVYWLFFIAPGQIKRLAPSGVEPERQPANQEEG